MHERKWPTFNAISEKPFSNPQATQLVEKGKKRARPDIRVEATASSHPLLADWRCTFPVAAKRRCDDHHECNSNTGWKEHQNYFHYGQKWGWNQNLKAYYKKSIGDKNESFLVIFQYCACIDEIFIRNILFKYRHTNDKITKVTKSYFPLSAPDKTPALTSPMPTPAARAVLTGGIGLRFPWDDA